MREGVAQFVVSFVHTSILWVLASCASFAHNRSTFRDLLHLESLPYFFFNSTIFFLSMRENFSRLAESWYILRLYGGFGLGAYLCRCLLLGFEPCFLLQLERPFTHHR